MQTLQQRLDAAVASIPTDVDIAEWLLEQGIGLVCEAVRAPGPRASNCPMAMYIYHTLDLHPDNVQVIAGDRCVILRSRDTPPQKLALKLWPTNVTAFIYEFDSAGVIATSIFS